MKALVTTASKQAPLELVELPEVRPGTGELLVRMAAASLNRGEIRYAPTRPKGSRIGWDLAGTVLEVGPEVSGFRAGDRIAGVVPSGGSFAEQVLVPASWCAHLPKEVDFVNASTLPVAGITAVSVLRLGQVSLGTRVLVTGAAGGVGQLCVQLASRAGAFVTGQARSATRAKAIVQSGAQDALVHPGDGSEIAGRYEVILDGIGGPIWRPLLKALEVGGRIVIYGNSADAESSFRFEELYGKAATVTGFWLFQDLLSTKPAADLTALLGLVKGNALKVHVDKTASLADALPLIRDFYGRGLIGKAVLTSG